LSKTSTQWRCKLLLNVDGLQYLGFTIIVSLRNQGKKGFPSFQKDNRSVEYKTSGWSLHLKARITITDKKGIGELKLLGKWDIHEYPVKSIKRVRLVRRADGYYCQFAVDVECVDIQPPTGQEIGLDVGIESFLYRFKRTSRA
jgi:transposase